MKKVLKKIYDVLPNGIKKTLLADQEKGRSDTDVSYCISVGIQTLH